MFTKLIVKDMYSSKRIIKDNPLKYALLYLQVCLGMCCMFYPQLIFSQLVMQGDVSIVFPAQATSPTYLVLEDAQSSGLTTVGQGAKILTENENNQIRWAIGNEIGSGYSIPFANSLLEAIPLSFSINTAGAANGHIYFSTYGTSPDNLPLPNGVNELVNTYNGAVNDGDKVYDRFWMVDASNYATAPVFTLDFGYTQSEKTNGLANSQEPLQAQYFSTQSNQWVGTFGQDNLSNVVANALHSDNSAETPYWTLIEVPLSTIDTVEACDSYTWIDGNTYTVSTDTPSVVLTNTQGLDSLVTLNLTIFNSFTDLTTIEECNSYTWPVNGETYNTSVTDTLFFTTANGCDSLYILELTIQEEVTPSFNPIDPVCEGESLAPLPLVSNEGIAGTWSPELNTNETTTYTFTPEENECATTTTLAIEVLPSPLVNASSNAPLCAGESLSLNTDEVPGASYSWSGPNNFSSNEQNPTLPTVDLNDAGEYILEVTLNGCSGSPTTVDVTVNETPTATVSSSDVCEGETIELNADASSGVTFNWTGPNGFSSNQQNPTIENAAVENDGVYELTVTLGACSSSPVSVNVAVLGTPTINTIPSSPICEGDDLVFQTNVVSGSTYEWTGPNGFTSNLPSPVINNVSTAASGTYELTVTLDLCSASETVEVVINSLPSIEAEVANVGCFGDSTGTISITPSGAAPFTYEWSPAVSSGNLATNLSIGQYTVTITDGIGCSNEATFTIDQPAPLAVDLLVNPTDCGLNTGSLTATPSGGTAPFTYEWNPAFGTSATLNNLPAGDYSLNLVDANGCSVQVSDSITTNGNLEAAIDPAFSIIEYGDDIDLTLVTTEGLDISSIEWEPTNTIVGCDTCNVITVNPLETTSYTVTLTTSDGCSIQVQAIVEVNPPCGEVFVPTIFTPNNDNNNDELCVFGGCYDDFSLAIYNRWGERVFFSSDPDECWDGTFRDKPLNTDVFMYTLIYTLKNSSEEVVTSGSFNLVR